MTASKLGGKLVDHDSISEPEARQQRRRKMEAILENERAFTRNLQRVAMAAWAATMLIPVAGIIFALIPAGGNEGLFIAFMLLGLSGALAFVLAILSTIAWMFRSRTTTMAAIEVRLASLENLVERIGGTDDER